MKAHCKSKNQELTFVGDVVVSQIQSELPKTGFENRDVV